MKQEGWQSAQKCVLHASDTCAEGTLASELSAVQAGFPGISKMCWQKALLWTAVASADWEVSPILACRLNTAGHRHITIEHEAYLRPVVAILANVALAFWSGITKPATGMS